MRELDDRALEALLRRTLEERAERARSNLTPEAIEERARARLASRSRTRTLTVLGVAAVLLLPVALALGQARPNDPPADETTDVVIVRPGNAGGIDVVAVRSDGRERQLRSIESETFALLGADVSPGGQLAIDLMPEYNGDRKWLLVDLAATDGRVQEVSLPGGAEQSSGGWAPDGRFSFWDSDGLLSLVDQQTGATERIELGRRLPLVLGWAADGSGLVVGEGGLLADGSWSDNERLPIYNNLGGPYPVQWSILGLDGSSTDTTLPAIVPRPRPRAYVEGARMQVCDASERGQQVGCPDLPDGAVILETRDGSISTVYRDELGPDRVLDGMFAADGEGLWLMTREADQAAYGLVHVNPGGIAEQIVHWGIGADIGGPPPLAGIAPDDSLVVARGLDTFPVGEVTVIATASATATRHRGTFAGFVDASTSDSWPGGKFAEGRPSSLDVAAGPAFAPLQPIDQLIGEQLAPGADRAVLVREHKPTTGEAGPLQTFDLGAARLQEGYGVLLRCSGPSDVTLTMDLPGVFFEPALVNRCLSPSTAVGGSTGGTINRDVVVTVTSDAATHWQVLVFDPVDVPE